MSARCQHPSFSAESKLRASCHKARFANGFDPAVMADAGYWKRGADEKRLKYGFKWGERIDTEFFNDLLRQRVKRVYTIGAAAEKIESQIKTATEIDHSGTLETAVKRAAATAEAGDIVLLAPACASFDQFKNYEHRGRVFKETVRALAAQ